jgi:hypothetical protein
VKLHTGVAHDGVEAHSMLALHALLELRVDIERHLGFGVPDLAHDPLDVEAIGQQSDGDVGPPQTVRRRRGSGGRPLAERLSVASVAASRTISATRCRLIRPPRTFCTT